MSCTLAEHRGYLEDEQRLSAYRQALSHALNPGDVVLDLGTGTGVLGVLAAQAGAGRVYAVDASDMLGLARVVVKANGLEEVITLVKGHSQAIDLPERVDVVVADQLGPFGIEAGVLAAYADSAKRHLKPGGTTIPSRIDLVVAPAQADELWGEVSFWDEPSHGVDITAIAPHARNARYFTNCAAEHLLAEPTTIASLDLTTHGNAPIRATLAWKVTRAGALHGLAGWFSARLAPGVEISNSPLDPVRLDRSHLFLPADAPVQVREGDTIEAKLHVVPPHELTRWTIVVRDADGAQRARSSHSTLDPSRLFPEDLARTRPDHKPTLGPRGRARHTALSLIDGNRTLGEIEGQLWERHRDVFDSAADASAFVARLVARDSA